MPGLERVIHSIPWLPGQVPDLFPRLAADVLTLTSNDSSLIRAAEAALGND